MKNSKVYIPIILLALIFYSIIAVMFISEPGISSDEAYFGCSALNNSKGDFGMTWGINIGDTLIPLMYWSYVGAVKFFIYKPIFLLFGVSPLTLRFPMIFLGLATLVVIYSFLKKFFDKKIALLSLLFLATDPSYIFHHKLGWDPIAIELFLKSASLYLLYKWYTSQDKKWQYLAVSSFMLGLGLYSKVTFGWYIAALCLSSILILKKEFLKLINAKRIIICLFHFLLGCAPLIFYNIITKGETFSRYGIYEKGLFSRLAFENLAYKFSNFIATLNGTGIYFFINRENLNLLNSLFRESRILSLLFDGNKLVIFLITAVFFIILHRENKKIKLILYLFIFMLFQIFMMHKAEALHHFMSISPFPQIIVSFALFEIKKKKILFENFTRYILFIVTFLILTLNALVDLSYLKSFTTIGGRGEWSDAIYKLLEFAKTRPNVEFLSLDLGVHAPLLLLSDAAIKTEELFCKYTEHSPEEIVQELSIAMKHSFSTIYFLHPHRYLHTTIDLSRYFFEVAETEGLSVNLLKTFYERDGTPVYLLYEVINPNLVSDEGHFFYFWKEHEFISKKGGKIIKIGGAINNKALGGRWGGLGSDEVLYSFSNLNKISDINLVIRYATGGNDRQFVLFIDGKQVETLFFEETNGWGYKSLEWKIGNFKVSADVEHGKHVLKLKPYSDNNAINIDFLYLYAKNI